MTSVDQVDADAVVIGGGFYGVCIACYLVEVRGLKKVFLLEREKDILQRASYTNQARIHNGYHYPRSFTTAYRSRVNLPRFVEDWPQAAVTNFTKLYAIARKNSKVTAHQFERFCTEIEAEFSLSKDHKDLFNKNLIEQVYAVKEFAFNTLNLAKWAYAQISRLDIQLQLDAVAQEIQLIDGGASYVVNGVQGERSFSIKADYIFNCTYSGLNTVKGIFSGTYAKLKHEVTEMALVEMPSELKGVGVTVMDGPFFSFMPFPARGLHTLSHVRYTPHYSWVDDKLNNPYEELNLYHKQTRVDRMVRDVARYIPAIADAKYEDSLFEVKTVLVKNEGDDGRPILFEKHQEFRGIYSVLGGKIDNIYDILEQLDNEPLEKI